MAFPTSFDESNATLSRPINLSDEECTSLSILRTETKDKIPVVVSCWKLTADELKEIIKTKRVWLGILGQTMPPAFIAGQKPF